MAGFGALLLSDQQTTRPEVKYSTVRLGAVMRSWRALLLTAAFGALLAACGGSNNNRKPAATAPAAGASAAATRSASPVAGAASSSTAAAAAASATSAAAKVTRGGTLTIAIDSNMKNLDPLKSTLLVDRQIHYQLYDSLVAIDTDLKIQPGPRR